MTARMPLGTSITLLRPLAEQSERPGLRLRACTMNVQTDEGDPRRVVMINRELRRLRPDVIALQEVVYPQQRNHLAELIGGTDLAHTTHQAGVLSHSPPGWERYGGTALATRWPHSVRAVLEHPPDAQTPFHWWTLAASVAVPGAGDQLVILPTTPWEFDATPARGQQFLDVAELEARERGDLPTLVLGDLNAVPDSAEVRFLTEHAHFTDAWASAAAGTGYTWSADNPLAAAQMRLLGTADLRRRIDYVLIGPGPARPRVLQAELIGAHAVHGVWLSDHAGVLIDLDLQSAQEATPPRSA